jgi:hypothetical protein
MPKTTPLPIFRALGESTVNRISVDVPQLLDSFGVAPYVEVVITRLPERRSFYHTKFARGILLKHLQRDGQFAALRFTDQQVDMFRHDDIAAHEESIPMAGFFQGLEKTIAGTWSSEQRIAVLTTEGEEMETPSFLVTLETPRHGHSVIRDAEYGAGIDLNNSS